MVSLLYFGWTRQQFRVNNVAVHNKCRMPRSGLQSFERPANAGLNKGSHEVMNILDLTGKTALVTGAGQGVGKQAALHLAAYGAKVVVNDYFRERAQQVADEINRARGAEDAAVACAADVSDLSSIRAMADEVKSRTGAIHILVNNAGNAGPTGAGVSGKPFWEQEPAEWNTWMGVNFYGVLNTCRVFLPDMIASGAGSIVNVISDAGRVGEANMEIYSGAKAGAAGFTRALSRSVGRFNVRANCVAISATRTPATEKFLANEEFAKRALSKYVLRRFGEPSDVANMIVFLASEAAAWITGQTYPVNGGFDMAM
jgi:3-oxoacyl-[acyl-carrier protein] reductase